MTIQDILPRLEGVKPDGKGWKALCPAHDDHQPSLCIDVGENNCVLLYCHAGCPVDTICKSLGISAKDLFPQQHPARKNRIETVFDWQKLVGAFTKAEERKLADWRGLSLEFVRWLHTRAAVGLYQGKFAFPNHRDGGAVVSCHVRMSNGDWIFHPKGQRTAPLVFGDVATAANILAFESQWDAFAIMDKLAWHLHDGLPEWAVFITRGAGNGGIARSRFAPDAVCYAFEQNEPPKPGKKLSPAQEWTRELAAVACCRVLRVAMPSPYKDANDWTRAGATREKIEAAIHAAKPVQAEKPGVESPTAAPETGIGKLLSGDKPRVQLPGDNRQLSTFAAEIGSILSRQNVFNRSGIAFILNTAGEGLAPLLADTLRTFAEDFLVCYKLHGAGNGILEIKRTMTVEDARGVLAAPQFLSQLRPLIRLNPLQMPIMRENGTVELLPAGYDWASHAFTVACGDALETLPLKPARQLIEELLAEFPFADTGRSKAVVVAAMLTVFAGGLLPPKSLRPCFVFLANAEGAGKTRLVEVCTVPVLGYAPTGTLPGKEEEVRKTLLTTVAEARSILFFDNVKKELSSAALEGFLTCTDYEGRLLSVNKFIRAPNLATVFVTGNGCTVSPDIRRRSLFVELFMEAERAEDRTFRSRLEVADLLAKRTEILSALWSLIHHWHHAGKPKPSKTSASFPVWSDIIGGIVEAAGFACPLEAPEIEGAADTELADMRNLVAALATDGPVRPVDFGELVELARAKGLFAEVLPLEGDLDRAAKSELGKLLRRFDGRLVADCRFKVLGAGKSRKFSVERLPARGNGYAGHGGNGVSAL